MQGASLAGASCDAMAARERWNAVAGLMEGDRQRVRNLLARFRAAGASLESEVRGWSMTGCLASGDRIRIHCAAPAIWRRGAVVAAVARGGLVAHRVAWVGRTRRSRGWLIARGDATMLCDAPVAVDDIVGQVTGVDTGSGWQAVPPPPRRRSPVRAALVLAVCVVALELHPGLAGRIARALWRWKARREGVSIPLDQGGS
ncbi:MAG: hypothetical protein ACKVQQ_04960 [Burkholderiales bacterium]